MTLFDEWLYRRAPVYVEDNYLSGIGSQAVGDAEQAEIALWAEAVYARLAE